MPRGRPAAGPLRRAAIKAPGASKEHETGDHGHAPSDEQRRLQTDRGHERRPGYGPEQKRPDDERVRGRAGAPHQLVAQQALEGRDDEDVQHERGSPVDRGERRPDCRARREGKPRERQPGTIVARASATPWRARSAVRLASRMASSDPTPNAE